MKEMDEKKWPLDNFFKLNILWKKTTLSSSYFLPQEKRGVGFSSREKGIKLPWAASSWMFDKKV
jgi:hypothetical protein